MTQFRDIALGVLSAIAYHEAGHAVAHALALREAHLPNFDAPPNVKYAAIRRDDDGKASGICFGANVYDPHYVAALPGGDCRDAMQWQIVIDMAGGAAEAIHRGERNKREIMWFALFNCGTEGDLETASAVLADLNALTSKRYGLNRFVIRAVELLRANWPAVESIAAVLIRDRYIDNAEIAAAVVP
jgi:hypothetical protein